MMKLKNSVLLFVLGLVSCDAFSISSHYHVMFQKQKSSSLLMSSSPEGGGGSGSLAGKVICQRSIYQLYDDGVSDVLGLEDFSIEERTRFLVGDDGRTLEALSEDSSSIYLRRGADLMDGKKAPELTTKTGKVRKFTRLGPKATALTNVQISEEDADSIFATALLFAARPHWIKGTVLEVGCGLGLGGLLSCLAAGMAEEAGELDSNRDKYSSKDEEGSFLGSETKSSKIPKKLDKLILTDTNVEILEDALINCATSGIPTSNVDIKVLDWKDHISRGVPGDLRDKFDVIIGSDVASEYPVVNPLSKTVAYMLKSSPYDSIDNLQSDGGLFVHVSPEQRERTLLDFRRKLRSGYKIACSKESLAMERIDLKPLILDSLQKESEQMEDEILGDAAGFVEYQQTNVFSFTVLSGRHDENYNGYDGEYFFPAETGVDDSDSPGLEQDPYYNKRW